ncbi:MAG: Ferritin-like domain [Thermoleophilaceae bacterium]|nr:Ferritin-like domain [Thermoleophilaceae bacterium]
MLAAAGAGGGVATALASCGGGHDNPEVTQTVSPEQSRSDAAVMNALLDLERMAVLAYDSVLEHLTGAERRLAMTLREHEREHQRAAERAIRDLGAHPVPARPDGSYTSGFPPLRSEREALRFALDVENTQVSAYGDSLGSLVTPELRVTLLAILGAEAEHMSAILGRLHEPQAGRAFVTGNAPT